MGIRSKRRARGPAPDPPSRRRRKDVQHVHGLPWEAEWRDWAALPSDVLWVILSLVPQADVLRGAGRACSSWRRLALDEPLLWRHIDLAAVEDMDKDPPAGWRAMARAAVRRSAGRCESYRGRVDDNILPFLGRRAPSLRSLHVTCRYDMPGENFVVLVAKKLPMLMLEQLVLSSGLVELASLAALVGHCPRLRVLDAGGCHAHSSFDETLVERLESKIKDLRLPVRVFSGGFLGPPNAPPYTGAKPFT